jgi:hypothetical protein
LAQARAGAALRDNHLSAHPLDRMILPHNDDSEAQWRRSRRFSLRVRSRPPPPRPSHPAGTRGLGGPCSRPSFSLLLAGRVVRPRACEGASGPPHRGATSGPAGATPAAAGRTAPATSGAPDLCNLGRCSRKPERSHERRNVMRSELGAKPRSEAEWNRQSGRWMRQRASARQGSA